MEYTNQQLEVFKTIEEFFGGVSKIPNTTTEYTRKYPAGLSRTALKSKFQLTYTDILVYFGIKKSVKDCKRQKDLRVLDKVRELGYILLGDPTNLIGTRVLELQCTSCGTVEIPKTVNSLLLCTKGCRSCKVSNLPWSSRLPELRDHVARYNAELLSTSVVGSQTSKVTIRYNCCGLVMERPIVLLVNKARSDFESTCPSCVQSSKKRYVYAGIVFDSQFERDCYKVLEASPLLGRTKLKIPYKSLASTPKQWNADFVVDGNIILEVSSFKPSSQGYASYMENIGNKSKWAVSNGFTFIFVNSLSDMVSVVHSLV